MSDTIGKVEFGTLIGTPDTGGQSAKDFGLKFSNVRLTGGVWVIAVGSAIRIFESELDALRHFEKNREGRVGWVQFGSEVEVHQG